MKSEVWLQNVHKAVKQIALWVSRVRGRLVKFQRIYAKTINADCIIDKYPPKQSKK